MNIPNGYGTYVSAAILAAAAVAHKFGWIDDSLYQMLLGLAGGGGLAFVRRSVAVASEKSSVASAVIAKEVGVKQAVIDEQIVAPAPSTAPAPAMPPLKK